MSDRPPEDAEDDEQADSGEVETPDADRESAGEGSDAPLSDLKEDIKTRRQQDAGERPDSASGSGADSDSGIESGSGADSDSGIESGSGADSGASAESSDKTDRQRRRRTGGSESTGPLSGLREDLEERRKDRHESNPEAAEAFEEASEPMLDGEEVWQDLLSGKDDDAGVLGFGEEVDGEEANVRVIPNRVCHNCKYLGDPPELHCDHEGTTIRRMVDMEHYEVVECPVVKNRSDLGGD